MRVGINTRFLLPDKMEGFGWYTFEVTRRIVLAHPEVEFYFFFDRAFDPKFVFAENVKPIVLHPQARHPILFRIWFNFSITRALKKYKIDVFFSPDGYLSLRTNVPQVGTIHDLNFEHFPNDLPKAASQYLRNYFPKFARKASHILTVSEFSKQDIATTYQIDSSKITVAFNGINPNFRVVSEEEKAATREKYTNGEEFILFVGSIHPRKNLDRLLKAFDQFKKEQTTSTQLLIVGDRYWWTDELQKTFDSLEFKDEVHFTGHLDQEALILATGSAKFMTYLSYFEGFGLPVGESMKSGVAVLASDQTSIPEVGGDAVHYVDPFSSSSIVAGLLKLDQDQEYRSTLVEKGFKQAAQFSWDTTAKDVWKVLNNQLR
ncbi:MAG: glycosyltransferase family 4 protein [Crocinitomicaceae bacterium]|nr:glycosyltransferase family 4 protein [Crocinitomicaceae bacterium]